MRKSFIILIFITSCFLISCTSTSVNNKNSNYTIADFEKSNEYKTFINYLSFNKNQMINKLGSKYESGTVAIEQAHVMFYSYFYEKLGISFIYGVDEGDSEVDYLECNDNVNVLGAKSGMRFKEIQEKLGKSEVQETWIADEDVKVYKIEYEIGDLTLKFISYDKDGESSTLDIMKKKF